MSCENCSCECAKLAEELAQVATRGASEWKERAEAAEKVAKEARDACLVAEAELRQERASRTIPAEQERDAARARAEAAERERDVLRASVKRQAESFERTRPLCPDHRDKMAGRGCLACRASAAERRLARVEALVVEFRRRGDLTTADLSRVTKQRLLRKCADDVRRALDEKEGADGN